MLIVCPSCASEYMIDPERIGAEGRHVRCATCKETWFVAPEAGEPEADTLAGDDPDFLRAAENADPADEAEGGPQDEEYSTEASPDRPSVAALAAAEAPPGRARRLPAAALFGLALVVLAGAAGAVFGRTAIVQAVPASAALYAAVGYPVNLRGLEFRSVRSALMEEGGDTVLVVEGEVANISGRDAPLPPIEIGLRGPEGQMLYTWTSEPPRPMLTAGDPVPFRARLAAPPAEATQVLVRFAGGREGAAVASHGR